MKTLYEIMGSTIAEWTIARETEHHWFTPEGLGFGSGTSMVRSWAARYSQANPPSRFHR